MSSRFAKSRSARPTISSDVPSEYMFAVSKKLMPASTARWMIGRLCASGSVHGCVPRNGSPNVMQPSTSFDTSSPVDPNFTYSIARAIEVELTAGCAPRIRRTVAWYPGRQNACGVAASYEGSGRQREVVRAPAAQHVRSGAGRLLTWPSAIGCRNAEKPVSMICTPMHSSRNADTRFATLVPSLPR